jgi:hypothetical protein
METENELRPCPFCGKMPELAYRKAVGCYVYALKCPSLRWECSGMPMTDWYKTSKEAMSMWNMRKEIAKKEG